MRTWNGLGVDLWIARANEPLRQLLTATGLTKRLGEEHIYPSVRAAVVAYQTQFGEQPPDPVAVD